jgi:hypothetical protein
MEQETLVNPLTKLIKPYVSELMADALKGDHTAEQVIATYEMYKKVPQDGAAYTLCECFFNSWLAKRKPASEKSEETE